MRLLVLAALVAARAEQMYPELRGRLTAPGKGSLEAVVVWLWNGAKHAPVEAPAPRIHRMSQLDKDFSPRVLAIRAGDSVDFENLDPVFHNVFSLDKDNPFDLGYFKGKRHFGADMKTESREAVSPVRPYPAAGKFRVFCNIHPDMVGTVYVFDHPFYAAADARGLFSLPVPSTGTWVLGVDGPRLERAVQLEVAWPAGVAAVALKAGAARRVAHTRKDGKPYPERGGGY